MALHQSDIIDALSEDEEAGVLVLSLLDEREWSDVPGHWDLLCTKLDRYLNFLASGEVLDHFPACEGGPFRIEIVFWFPPPPEIVEALDRSQAFVAMQGHSLLWALFPTESVTPGRTH